MHSELLGPIGHKQYRGYIGDIHKSGQHLLDIINDILDMSKIESGKMEPREEVVDLGDVVSSCLTLTTPRAQEMQHDVRVDLPGHAPQLSGDSHMIKRILLNLLSNAVKFTPRGGKIDVRVAPDHSGGLNLSVSDTGIGIAAEDVEKVWMPFGQVENPMQRIYQGTGLGLPLVKSMAELHQATVDMKSVPGGGTTVAVRFPRERIIRAA
jgi:signal transduction histidine kinase